LDVSQLALTIGFLVLLFALIVLCESVALQMLSWGEFKRSLQASFWMNLASSLPSFLLLYQTPRLGIFGLLVAWALSWLIEFAVLNHMLPGEKRYCMTLSASANVVSNLLLILPAYLSSFH
jgi:hypothetical protein